mmetsp:Transcript_17061/g.33375  ORF Transcript_17061/g.33375 Transcript_17061/m.33375 type:complete len:449 (-) Transcript_17061:1500-2846(-)
MARQAAVNAKRRISEANDGSDASSIPSEDSFDVPSANKRQATGKNGSNDGDESGLGAQGKQKLRKLRKYLEVKMEKEAVSLDELDLNEPVMEVQVMTEDSVMVRIEKVVVELLSSILSGKGFAFKIPSRGDNNIKYIEELDRIVLKADKFSERQFVNTKQVRGTTILLRMVQLVHNILQRGIHITKRDLFYTDVKLFVEQGQTDKLLDDVSVMLGCTRTSLNVVASEKGVVVGDLRFKEAEDEIDCSRLGIGGKGIPPMIDRVTDIRSDADFILLVEKDAAFMRLSEDRFYKRMKCIIITARGQPDVATRMFLRRLRNELKIPVLALVDSDPYGLKILSVYMSGSKNMAYDANSLTCPDIKWLGVRPSDLDRYKIPAECRLELTDQDRKTGEALLKEDFIKKNPEWVKELNIMLKMKKKAEIQALSTFGFQFLTEVYLPEKIRKGDWI